VNQDPLLIEEIVPNEELRFESRDEAEEFYKFYASKEGFDVRITKTRKTVLERVAINKGTEIIISLVRREFERKCQ